MAGTKSISGIALAKANGPDISLLMIKSKLVNVPLYSLAKIHTYLAERKNVTAFFMNGKSPLQTASQKANTS